MQKNMLKNRVKNKNRKAFRQGVVQRYIYLYRMEITLYKEVLKKLDYRLKSSKNQ